MDDDGRRYDMDGRGAERNDEPRRQAGRRMMSDELMRTAREKVNCHLPGIYSCPRALSRPSRFSSRSSSRLSSRFLLPSCLLARFVRRSHSHPSHPASPAIVSFVVSFIPSRMPSRCLPLVACLSLQPRPRRFRSLLRYPLLPDASPRCRPRVSHQIEMGTGTMR